jgi:hypothetical protein
MPVWLTLLTMVLAVYRGTRLVVMDTFPPVLWVRDRLAGGWRKLTPGELAAPATAPWRAQQNEIEGVLCRYVTRWARSPQWLADLLSCAWCASGWVTGAVTAATALTVPLPHPWLAGPAVWGGAVWLLDREKAVAK